MGVTLLYSADERETADLLLVLARREEGGGANGRPTRGRPTGPSANSRNTCFSAFPDIGPRTARALLEAFGSLLGVLTADPAALEAVPGVGRIPPPGSTSSSGRATDQPSRSQPIRTHFMSVRHRSGSGSVRAR